MGDVDLANTVLSGQRVAILGGSSGIGFAVAEAAIAAGASVVVGSSQLSKVDAARARLGGEASGQVVDVSDEASVAAFFDNAGALDHLVFTAGDSGGGMPPPDFAQLDIDAARKGANVRFWGALAAIKHALPRLKPTGSITLTDGLLARRPRKGFPLASAFGGAIEHLVPALALDLAPIRINSVCPGLVLTEMTRQIPPQYIEQMTSGQPVPRPGRPEELAGAYLHLMTSTYTTGQVLVLDGGSSIA